MSEVHAERPAAPSMARLMTALIVGALAPILDSTIVAIGIRTLVVQLHSTVGTVQWVSTGYLLALAVAIPFVGWLQGRFGAKRLWLASTALFAIGGVLCACAPSVGLLIAARIVQGFGGGVMLPLMQTIAMQNTDPDNRVRVVANISLPIALGPILGPTLGGIVLHWLSWHFLFIPDAVLAVVGIILAAILLPRDAPAKDGPRSHFDWLGAVFMVPALAGLMYGLTASRSGGFERLDVLVPVIGGFVLLAAFVLWAVHRADSSLIDVRLLGHRSVAVASGTLTFAGAVSFAGNFLLPLFFQTLRGDSVLTAALLLIPQGIGTFLSRFFVGKLDDRIGSRAVAVGGFVLMALATIPFAFAGVSTSLWLLGVVLFIRGVGNGLVLVPTMAVAYVGVDRGRMPHASAITRIVQQVGGAFGTAVLAVIVSRFVADPATGFHQAFWWLIAFTVAPAVIALFLPSKPRTAAKESGSRARRPEPAPAPAHEA